MNFIERFVENLKKAGSSTFIEEVHGEAIVPYSGEQILSWAGQFQSLFSDQKLKPGDRVALLAPNSAKWVACDLACLLSGVISVPLYSRQDPKELSAILKDCQPSLLIISDDSLKKELLRQWVPTCPTLTFDSIPSEEKKLAPVIRTPSEPVTIVYTSGTSGEPKGVMLSEENIEFMLARTTGSLERTKKNKNVNDRVFHFLPCCFLGSRLMMWTQIYRGNRFMFSTDLKNLAQEIGTAKPNYFLTVPAVLDRIRNGVTAKVKEKGGFAWKAFQSGGFLAKFLVYPKIRKKIGPNLQFIICGSAPLSAECQIWFQALGISVLQVYGLTETTGIVSMDEWNTAKGGFVGKTIDGCETKMSSDGELLVRGPNNFLGYWNKPEATKEVLRDGWIYTGDQCEFDLSGRLKILGRLKNVIVPSSGHNIAPEPIEQTLVESVPGAEHAFVVGHGRPYLSVLITGNIKQDELEKTIDQLNASVPHYKKIRKFKHVDDHFTIENGLLTANQKVKRKAIEKQFKPVIDKLYEGNA